MMRRAVIASLLATAFVASAATPPSSAPPVATSQREIESLILALGRSGCAFERNGEWFDGARAQTHLRRKYDYLRRRDPAGSAESFIERAASRSSTSGKPYRVRCPGKAVEPASAWFLRQLQTLRR